MGLVEKTSPVHIDIEDSSPVISEMVRFGRQEELQVRCAGRDGFPMSNVINSYQHHLVWTQELEVT